jgi:hypothetical protein
MATTGLPGSKVRLNRINWKNPGGVARVPYVSKYRYDVFISYAHGLARAHREDPLGRWTRQLVEDLTDEVMVNLATKDPSRRFNSWMDPKLRGNQPLTDTLKETIEQSALLLVVMSPFFLESSWCPEEIEWFRQACLRRGETIHGRVFVVRAFPTDESRWPSPLLDSSSHPLSGYRFHHPADAGDHATRPFGWAGHQTADPDYSTAINQMASDISRQLGDLTVPRSEAARDTVTPPLTQSQPQPTTGSIFLGYVNDTLIEERAELRERLAAAGVTVLPPEDEDPVDEASLRAALDTYLRRADSLVLMANEYRASWPKDRPGGAIDLQIQEARTLDKPVEIWLQDTNLSKVRRVEYREYLESFALDAERAGLTIRHADLDSFAKYVAQRMASADTRRARRRQGDVKNAVICTNRPKDEVLRDDYLGSVTATLSELRQISITFDFDPEEATIQLARLEKCIRDASTVLVVCFDQEWDWVTNLLLLLNDISHVRADGKLRLVVAGPRDRKGGRYNATTLGFRTVEGIDKDAFELGDLLRQAILSDQAGSLQAAGARQH